MKTILTTTLTLAFCLAAHANDANEERAEMKEMAEQIRRCAEENKNAKLDDCENEAPALVKAAAVKVVASRNKLGAIEEQLAAAYDAGDKKRIQQLHKEKNDAELECEFSEKEKRVAYVMNNVNELIRDMPDSPDAKELKQKTEAKVKSYLDNSKKVMELQKEQMHIEKEMESVDSRIEIIKKREELKKLEQEASENK